MNNTKINPALAFQIKELISAGINCTQIAIKTGLSRGTVESWAKKNNLVLPQRNSVNQEVSDMKFVELIRSGKTIAEARKELGIGAETAQRIINQKNIRHLTRTRAEAALDKTLSLEEATSRLPENTGIVTGYNQKNKKYTVTANDGYIFYKSSAKLWMGDPRGKSGTSLSIENVRSRLAKADYTLISDFYKKREPLKAIHNVCGRVRETRLSEFFQKECASCSNTGVSKEENGLSDWIKSLGLETTKFRFKERVTKPKEIDIFIPSLGIGIEYCGLYFHGERAGRNRSYHLDKQKQAESEGITLITLFSHEWIGRTEQLKSFLKAKLNVNDRTVYARKTELREISKEDAHSFLEKYHIQGKAPTKVAFGLFVGQELIAVVTGSTHHRDNSKFCLNRLCFKDGVRVVGGSSKLDKALCLWAKSKGFGEIVSWSHNRISSGAVYRALGYSAVVLPPDYFYVKGTQVFSKQSSQKKHLLAKGGAGDTEHEMALSLGYDRVWDCGKTQWTKTL